MAVLTPARRYGFEHLDDPATPPALRERSIRDVVRANKLLGGSRAVVQEVLRIRRSLGHAATLLDVGTGLADIPAETARQLRVKHVKLATIGLDSAESLVRTGRPRVTHAVTGSALALPFASRSVDVVTCSQVLHHFERADALTLVRELHRVARRAVVIGDLRRSWVAVGGFWLATFPMGFHPVSRHDGVTSILRGFTPDELRDLIREATGFTADVRTYLGYRVTALWVTNVGRP